MPKARSTPQFPVSGFARGRRAWKTKSFSYIRRGPLFPPEKASDENRTDLLKSNTDTVAAGRIGRLYIALLGLICCVFFIFSAAPAARCAESPEDSVPSFSFLVVYMLTGLSPGPRVIECPRPAVKAKGLEPEKTRWESSIAVQASLSRRACTPRIFLLSPRFNVGSRIVSPNTGNAGASLI